MCDQSKSVFTGHGIVKDSLLNLRIYSNQNPALALIVANFTDSSLEINQGLFQSFYTDGGKESECNYENGQLNGLWEKWDRNSHLIDSVIFDHGKIVDSTRFYYFKNGRCSSYDITNFKNDQFQQVVYNDSGKIVTEIFFSGQKGIRKDYSNSGITTDSLFTRQKKEASFPGGSKAWSSYISAKISSRINKFSNRDYGTCIVKFIIDTDGKVSDVHAVNMTGSELAAVAIDAIQTGPKWIPAMQYGRKIKAYRIQPVILSNPDPYGIIPKEQ